MNARLRILKQRKLIQMFRSKIIPKILCCLAALIGFSSTSYGETGRKSLLGMSLSEAEKTEYFGWFHLREIDRQTDAQGQTTVRFKPEGESVRDFVTVKVVVKEDKIIGIQLVLSRTFVEDRRTNGLLARDISKSLLLDAIPEADQPQIQDLVAAIQSNPENSDMIVLRNKPQIHVDPLTPGYQAYLGKQQSFRKQLSSTLLIIENTGDRGAELLQIMVSAK
jgi:hypothetical protein